MSMETRCGASIKCDKAGALTRRVNCGESTSGGLVSGSTSCGEFNDSRGSIPARLPPDGHLISRMSLKYFQVEQQIRRSRLSDRHGERHRREPREGRCVGKENVPLSAEWPGKFDRDAEIFPEILREPPGTFPDRFFRSTKMYVVKRVAAHCRRQCVHGRSKFFITVGDR